MCEAGCKNVNPALCTHQTVRCTYRSLLDVKEKVFQYALKQPRRLRTHDLEVTRAAYKT